MFCCFRKDSKKRKIQMLLHHLDVPKSAAVSLVLCLKLILLFLMQFSSFFSFNIWMCSCAEASLLLLNSCFYNCSPPYFTVVAEKEGPAGSILQTEIHFLNSITSLFRITVSGLLLVDSCLSAFFFHCLLHLAVSINSVEAW